MIVLVSTVALIGFVLWLQVLVRVRAELAFLTACSSVILVLYVAAVAGWLTPATVLLYAAGVVLGAVALVKLDISAPANRPILIVLGVFVLLSATAWFRLNGLTYHWWDEFAHWGRLGKALSVSGALPDARTGVMLKDYPPAAGLFEYFIMFSRFTEGRTYYGQALLLIASVLALARWTRPTDTALYVMVIALGLILVDVIGLGFETVETDHLLGAVFGAALGAFAVRDPLDRRSCLALVPVLFCIPLIKPIGLVLALGAAGVIALDLLRSNVLAGRGAAALRTSRSSLAWAAVCVSLIAAPVVAHQSWNIRTTKLQFRRTFDVKITADGLRALVTPSRRTATQQQVVANYRSAWKDASIGRFGNGMTNGAGVWEGPRDQVAPRTGPEWFGCLTVLSIVAVVLAPTGSRITQALVHAGLAAGCVAYMAVLLYAYFYGFGEYEATRVISFGRYASSWFIAWAFAVVASLGHASRGRRWQHAAAVLIMIPSMTWAAVRAKPVDDPAVRSVTAQRQQIWRVTTRVQHVIPPTSSTYVLWQASTGFPFHLIAYELTPRLTNTWCWSVGGKYYDGDLWTCPLSLEEFSRTLDDYDYLLIGHADDHFWNTYHLLFEEDATEMNRSAVLFRVARRGAAPKLRRVDTAPPS